MLDRQIDDLEVELAAADAKVDTASAELGRTQRRLGSLTASVEKKRGQLLKAQADLARQQDVLNDRAANLYKKGRLGYVEMVFQTERLNDLLNRLDLLSLIAEQDADLLDQIESLRRRVESEKAGLEQQQAAVAATEREQRQRTDDLRRILDRTAGRHGPAGRGA